MSLLVALLLAQATVQKVRVCDKTDSTQCAAVDSAGKVSIGGTISASSSCKATAADPSYTEGTDNSLSCDLTGKLRSTATGGGGGGAVADQAGSTATFNALSVCATVLTAGRASAVFNLSGGGNLNGAFTASMSSDATPSGSGCNAATGKWNDVLMISNEQFGSITTTVNVSAGAATRAVIFGVGASTCVKVCTSSYTSGSSAGFVTATTQANNSVHADVVSFGLQPVALNSGNKDSGTQRVVIATDQPAFSNPVPISAASLPLPAGAATEATLAGVKTGTDKIPASPSTDRATAAAPFSTRLSDGAAFYDAAKTGQLPAALDGSGFLKTHEQGTAAVSAASLPLPSGASTDRTTAAAPFSVRISDGAAFIDPRDVSDRVGRALGVVSVTGSVAVTGTFWQATQPVSGTFWQATQPVSGTVTANQGGAPWSENISQINGTTVLTGAGVTGAGSIRVTNATSDGNVLATANTGRLQVDVVSGGGSNTSVGADHAQAPDSSTQVAGNDDLGVLRPLKVRPDGTAVVQLSSTSVTLQIAPQVQQVDATGRSVSVKGPLQPPTIADSASVVTQSPVPSPVCTQTIAISQTATTRLVVGIPGRKIYICSVLVVSATGQSVALTEGTGTTCGTGALALIGHTTVASGVALAANGGFAQASASPFKVSQVVGDDLCLLQSGAGNVSGAIDYLQF